MLYNNLLSIIGFTDFMAQEYNKMFAYAGDKVEPMAKAYMQGDLTLTDAMVKLDAMETAEISRYGLYALLLLLSTDDLHKNYEKAGISDEIFIQSMKDITCKIQECIDYKGVFGTFVPDWLERFFNMTLFALGRLQFELNEQDRDVEVNGYTIHKGDFCPLCHIPSGEPLTHEACEQSYHQAHEFFKGKYRGNILPVKCISWLLYPHHKEVFGKNTQLFAADYTVLEVYEKEGFGNCWRVFSMDYTDDYTKYPQNTSLQRRFLEYMKNGGTFGNGEGYILCK